MITLSGHPFQPAALQQYVATAAQQRDPGKANVVIAAVDNNGVKVAVIFSFDHDALAFQVAFAHDWSGPNAFGVNGSYSW